MDDELSVTDEVCRLLVIGNSKARLSRIVSSLLSPQRSIANLSKCGDINCRIEYLPCVAKFSSYVNESKELVRYLESIEHFPLDASGILDVKPSTLLPYFDQEEGGNEDCRFPLIAGVAIGIGIEGPDDTARVHAFIKTMLSGNSNPIYPKLVTVEPNPGYQSMTEELAAYKQLSPTEKEDANRLQTMGPEKMVKFIIDFAHEIIMETFGEQQQPQPDTVEL
jgi:hypothetical protein